MFQNCKSYVPMSVRRKGIAALMRTSNGRAKRLLFIANISLIWSYPSSLITAVACARLELEFVASKKVGVAIDVEVVLELSSLAVSAPSNAATNSAVRFNFNHFSEPGTMAA